MPLSVVLNISGRPPDWRFHLSATLFFRPLQEGLRQARSEAWSLVQLVATTMLTRAGGALSQTGCSKVTPGGVFSNLPALETGNVEIVWNVRFPRLERISKAFSSLKSLGGGGGTRSLDRIA